MTVKPMRWKVKKSIFNHNWVVMGKYGDRVVPGSAHYFRSWTAAMQYVNERLS